MIQVLYLCIFISNLVFIFCIHTLTNLDVNQVSFYTPSRDLNSFSTHLPNFISRHFEFARKLGHFTNEAVCGKCYDLLWNTS